MLFDQRAKTEARARGALGSRIESKPDPSRKLWVCQEVFHLLIVRALMIDFCAR